ncbi:hypothetical protein G6F43_003915 [Rhizopus delemar]|nr:hypothetical protein G6F43_003915 [Rhizopus delemar]
MQQNRSERRAIHRAETKRLKKEVKKLAKNGTNSNQFNSKKSQKISPLMVCKKSEENIVIPPSRSADIFTITPECVDSSQDVCSFMDPKQDVDTPITPVQYEFLDCTTQLIEGVEGIKNSSKIDYVSTEENKKQTDMVNESFQGLVLLASPFDSFIHDQQSSLGNAFLDKSPILLERMTMDKTQDLDIINKLNDHDSIHTDQFEHDDNVIQTVKSTPQASYALQPTVELSSQISSALFESETSDVIASITNSGSSEEVQSAYLSLRKDETKQTDDETLCGKGDADPTRLKLEEKEAQEVDLCALSYTSTERIIRAFPSIYPSQSTVSSNLDKKRKNVFSRVFRKESKEASCFLFP